MNWTICVEIYVAMLSQHYCEVFDVLGTDTTEVFPVVSAPLH